MAQSQIIGRTYDPYSMPSLGANIAGALERGRAVARQRGLASGFTKITNGDNSGWAEVAANAPEMYLKKLEMDRQGSLTPYQMEMIKLKNKELENRGNKELSPYERTLQMEQAKNDIEIARGDEDFKKMSPSVIGALDRAKKSLNSGSGVGPIGGTFTKFGLNPIGKSAENYANIESANTQMNQLLRAKLKATGLTGSELNSAVEANAYRYTISPTDNEDVVMQKILNFETDVLGAGKQQKQDDPLGIL